MAKTTRRWGRRTPQQWQALLARQAASGQSVEAFCRDESITPGSFYRWRKQLGGKESLAQDTGQDSAQAPTFVDMGAVGGADSGAGDGWELELALGGGVVLRLRGG